MTVRKVILIALLPVALLLGHRATARATIVDFTFTGSYETYTIPTTGTYDITAWGAQGGLGGFQNLGGGKGAEIGGAFTLTAGENLQILTGEAGGQDNPYSGGGGGASFVGLGSSYQNATALLVAGGGGGSSLTGGGEGVLSPSGTGAGGSGGSGSYGGGGGGGYTGNGGPGGTSGGLGGQSFIGGGSGGEGDLTNIGGIGGGGGGTYYGGGGGGGYTGGTGGNSLGGIGGSGIRMSGYFRMLRNRAERKFRKKFPPVSENERVGNPSPNKDLPSAHGIQKRRPRRMSSGEGFDEPVERREKPFRVSSCRSRSGNGHRPCRSGRRLRRSGRPR